MSIDSLPPGLPAEGVQTGKLNLLEQYRRHISELNASTPTAEVALEELLQLGTPPEKWDECVSTGELRRENHTHRALIAIARGDERPLGIIYDELRRQAGAQLDKSDVRKTRELSEQLSRDDTA